MRLTSKTRISDDGINFRNVTIEELEQSAKDEIKKLTNEMAKIRDELANMVSRSGNEPFNFGLDWAMSGPEHVSDFVAEVSKHFNLVKN